jgi:hypothetical protein
VLVLLVDDEVMLAGRRTLDYCVNHSCDPVVLMADEITVVLRRDIAAGGEITGDYALWKAEDSLPRPAVLLRRRHLRGAVCGRDWQRAGVPAPLRGHSLPYVERRFRQSV